MGALASGLDLAVQQMCNAAGIMVAVADQFPPSVAIGRIMPLGVGGPGSLAEGAEHWLAGAEAMGQAQQELTRLAATLSADQWTGPDRAAFDLRIEQLAAQFGDSHDYATAVGATLAGLSVPLAAYGPFCLTIGGILLAEALAFDAAAASVVGDLGASEAIYAEACAAAAACLTAMIAWNVTQAALLEAAVAVIAVADVLDVGEQLHHGDRAVLDDFVNAQVDGAGEALQNVESWGVGLAAGYAGGKAGDSLAGNLGDDLAGKAARAVIGGAIGNQIGNDNTGLLDIANGKDPRTTITDTLGVTPQVTILDGVIDEAEQH